MTQPSLVNLLPNEYSQELHYYPFAVKLQRCVGSCITLNDLYNETCIPNKTEDLSLSVFKLITFINESRTLTKHISCECKCKFDEKKCKSNQWWSNDKCQCECRKNHTCESGKYLASIMDDSVITCDKVIESCDEEINTIPTNFNEKNISCKTQGFYILLTFLLITITLLIAVSIYCYLIKYCAK